MRSGVDLAVMQRGRAFLSEGNLVLWLKGNPRCFRGLDAWISHRLRVVSLKHWRLGKRMYLALKALGASGADARKRAANSRSWWRDGRYLLSREMPVACFERLNAPGAVPHAG